MGAGLGRVALADIAVQFACFVVAAALQTELFFDVSASLTYILCILLSFRSGSKDHRQRVNTLLVITWAVRLGSFLLLRILKDGRDRRFDKVRTNPRAFFIFWAVQALWILVTALPVYIINSKDVSSATNQAPTNSTSSTPAIRKPIGLREVAGWSLWIFGFTIEAMADMQKNRFKANPGNAGRWIDTGLWSLAQHPNYFGEMCMWWGIFASCSSELQGLELTSIVSPMFVTYLLLGVSGVPLLRKASLKRWGHLPEYRTYLARTRLLLPLPHFG